MISERLRSMRSRVREREHARFRQDGVPDVRDECERLGLPWMQRVALATQRQCEAEIVVIEPDERIVFTRTVPSVSPVYSEEGLNRLFMGRQRHELGIINNICANWSLPLAQGLTGRREAALASLDRCAGDAEAEAFLRAAVDSIDAVLRLAGRYAEQARGMGRNDLAGTLERVPAYPARTFHEALQSLRFCHSMLWLAGHYHVGLGRFDQYMWPYLERDLEEGTLTTVEAEELLAEFFITLNRDSDLYPGVQQGDNGQSLMLGGVTRSGTDAVNELTRMVLRVAKEVCMIDPKINLRIDASTDLALLELAAQLTRQGLGFPQYSNDDVVIPSLIGHGYDLEDARDYTVAACWEFIIPGRGMEIVNIGAVSLPAAVNRGTAEGLEAGEGPREIEERIRRDIREQVQALVRRKSTLLLPPAPLFSAFMDGCLEEGRDLSRGAKYNNFGIHGAGSSNAADALAAAKRYVFEERSVGARELVEALRNNFAGQEVLRVKLADEGPKVGNNDECADDILVQLFDWFADACEEIEENGRGGSIRPGTGSAMYYIWLATGHPGMEEPVVGATADGRSEGSYFSSSLAPSPGARVRGPISVLQSFSKIDYRRIYNGGPITLELSDTVFRDPASIRKVAMLIRTFAQLGCQQMQLNTLNADILRDARRHPERHRDLIVRVWGWSGYFCELAPEYQDHIIARTMHAL
jgi:formate C-acetyltransferase